MATTAGGLPYVESSDLISGYPTVSQALAEELDDQLAAKLDASAYTPGVWTYITNVSLSGSSVSVNNCFTGAYTNYVLIATSLNTSAAANVYFRLRNSGTDSVTSYRFFGRQFGSATSDFDQSTSLWEIGPATTTNRANFSMQVFEPYLSRNTGFISTAHRTDLGTLIFGTHSIEGSYDGFTIYPNTGTFSRGLVRIYGLTN